MVENVKVDDIVISLDLTVSEINVILASLGKHPFDEIATLINKIKVQGDERLQQHLGETSDGRPTDE